MDKRDSKFYDLILACLYGIATEDQQNQLGQILEKDSMLRKEYLEYISLHTLLSRRGGASLFVEEVDDSVLDKAVWEALAEQERTSPEIIIPKEEPQPERELIQKVVYPPREKQKISKFSLYSAIFSAAAMLLMVLLVKFAPEKSNGIEVAVLNAAVDARWSDSTVLPESGDAVHANEPFYLVKGLVEIQTDRGVELIVEGPAEFEFTKDGDLSLDSGKVFAAVSTQGRGFAVNTATSKIVDLGTEFGVQVDRNGNAGVHVYKGQVTLLTGAKAMAKVTEFLLRGQARAISSDGTVSKRPVNEHLFVRKDELRANVRASEGSAYDRWLAYSYQLRRDPSLVAYYTFEKNPDRPEALINLPSKTSGRLEGLMEYRQPE
ncbi:MAG: FecR domain-containing protein, partial [Planctomycetota bacterium]